MASPVAQQSAAAWSYQNHSAQRVRRILPRQPPGTHAAARTACHIFCRYLQSGCSWNEPQLVSKKTLAWTRWAHRSAPHKVAEHFFRPRALLRILFFGDRAGLPPQLQSKNLILQRIKATANRRIDLG